MRKKGSMISMAMSIAVAASFLVMPSVQAVTHPSGAAASNEKVNGSNGNVPLFVKEKAAGKMGASNAENALAYLEKNIHKVNIQKPEETLKVKKVQEDKLGKTHIRFQQTQDGYPVEGAEIIVHFDKENRVELVNGHRNDLVGQKPLTGKIKVSEENALAIAKQVTGAPAELPYPPNTELVVYPTGSSLILTYKINVNFLGEHPGNWFVFINAETGQVVDKYNSIMHTGSDGSVTGFGIGVLGDKREMHVSRQKEGSTMFALADRTHEGLEGIFTYDMKNSWDYYGLPGDLFLDSDAAWISEYQKPAVDAHYNSEKVYEYFMEEHNRNSIDGNGMAIKSSVHYGENYNNAFWNGYQMTYGDGDGKFFIPLSAGLDVAGHEMAHGVTSHSAGLKYRFQSGALNEAFSDIFGALIDEEDWEVGEDIMADEAVASGRESLRSLSDPSKYPVGSAYVPYGDGSGMYPSHMDEYYDLPIELDNGGVHINSSIINHAAYITGKQIGKEALGQIYYRALTVYLTPESNFSEARSSIIQSAVDLYGEGSEEARAAADGFNQVGITE
ncbi:M4 family metallopeptidase [Bacillus marinisedimentorum]|uniref:M4 family metallopeptidase n=1 Tax=Bacillus marinisedimentorum TaxID=1821260 RepID=UPI000AB867E3|nr:M4 family metallopeptidase [Bacillus marinisedimentorum]